MLNEQNIKKKPNRRKAPDIWVYSSQVLAITSWLLFITALIVSFYAAPEHNYGLLRYYKIDVRETWLMPLTRYLYLILFLSAFSSYLCIILNKYRARRKNDNKNFNLVLLLVIVFAWGTYIFTAIN